MGSTLYKQVMWAIVLAGLLIALALHISTVADWVGELLAACVPLFIGAVLAFVLDIAVVRYERLLSSIMKYPMWNRCRRPISIVLAICTITAIFILIAWMAIPQMFHSITLMVVGLPAVITSLVEWITPYMNLLPDGGAQIIHALQSDSAIGSLKEWSTQGGSYIVSMIGTLMAWMFNLVIGFIFAVYILWEKEAIRRQFDRLLLAYGDGKWDNCIRYVCRTFENTFSNFIIGQCLDALVLGVLVGITLWGFNVSYAMTLACVVGLTGLIPLLGVYVGALIGALILFTVSPMETIIYLVVLEVIHQIESNIIYPKIVGDSIGLPGLWVFAGVIVGGTLFGVTGMILGVPIVAATYRLIKNDVAQRLEVEEEQ